MFRHVTFSLSLTCILQLCIRYLRPFLFDFTFSVRSFSFCNVSLRCSQIGQKPCLIELFVLIQAGMLPTFYNRNAAASEILCHQRQESLNTDKLMLKPCMCHQRVVSQTMNDSNLRTRLLFVKH